MKKFKPSRRLRSIRSALHLLRHYRTALNYLHWRGFFPEDQKIKYLGSLSFEEENGVIKAVQMASKRGPKAIPFRFVQGASSRN